MTLGLYGTTLHLVFLHALVDFDAYCYKHRPFTICQWFHMLICMYCLKQFTSSLRLELSGDARQWSQKLGRKLSLYHWGAPITSLPNEHADFTEDPQVNFTAMRLPLPASSHLHSSTVAFEDLDEEEDRKERTLMTGAKSSTTTTDVLHHLHHRTLPNSSTPAHHSQDRSANTTVHDSLSNSSSSTTSTTRQDKSATSDTTVLHEQTLPTTSNQPDCVCDHSAEVCHPDPLDESSSSS